MLVTITTTHQHATDIGYLLHKDLEKVQIFRFAYGQAHVFYPEMNHKRSMAIREFALGIEAWVLFVRKEPLRRVHEFVFGVLALESEPVDPRL